MTTLSRTEMIKHLERALEEFSNFDYWNEYLESAEHEIEQVLDALKADSALRPLPPNSPEPEGEQQ